MTRLALVSLVTILSCLTYLVASLPCEGMSTMASLAEGAACNATCEKYIRNRNMPVDAGCTAVCGKGLSCVQVKILGATDPFQCVSTVAYNYRSVDPPAGSDGCKYVAFDSLLQCYDVEHDVCFPKPCASSKAANEPCTDDAECLDGLMCLSDGSNDSDSKLCLQSLKQGESCFTNPQACGNDLYCQCRGSTCKCANYAQAGDQCSHFDPKDTSYYTETTYPACDMSLVCNGTCISRFSGSNMTVCFEDATCALGYSCVSGVCRELSKLIVCADYSDCDQGTCQCNKYTGDSECYVPERTYSFEENTDLVSAFEQLAACAKSVGAKFLSDEVVTNKCVYQNKCVDYMMGDYEYLEKLEDGDSWKEYLHEYYCEYSGVSFHYVSFLLLAIVLIL